MVVSGGRVHRIAEVVWVTTPEHVQAPSSPSVRMPPESESRSLQIALAVGDFGGTIPNQC